MSEDDNTNGAEDSVYSSCITINQNTDKVNVVGPTCNSYLDVRHTSKSPRSNATSPINLMTQKISLKSINIPPELINSSSNDNPNLNNSLNSTSGVSTSSEISKSVECSFEMDVSSTNILDDERTNSYCYVDNNAASTESAESSLVNQSPNSSTSLSINTKNEAVLNQYPDNKVANVDISGLELLSNSIEAFEKRPFIKQEPIDRLAQVSPITNEIHTFSIPTQNDKEKRLSIEPYEARNGNHVQQHISPVSTPHHKSDFVTTNEQLGGLNLLCALAEQHFQEEVGSECHFDRKRSSSSSERSEPKKVKKHKDRHSSKKSKKKDRKEKKRHGNAYIDNFPVGNGLEKDFRATFDRVKEKYTKCDCSKSFPNEPCCCKVSFPTPEEVYSAMKSDMRQQLADIKRKVKAEERKLDAISNKDRLQRESTPSSTKSSESTSKLSTTTIPTFSPSILSASSLEQDSGPNDATSIGKVLSDSESSSSSSSKRKRSNESDDIVFDTHSEHPAPSNKRLVSYIFASKKRQNDGNVSTNDETSIHSDASAANRLKQRDEIYEFEDIPTPKVEHLLDIAGNDENKVEVKRKPFKLKQSALSKHHKKNKGEKERKHRRHSSEHCKRRLESKCLLTAAHLDQMDSSNGDMKRVLIAMGGLFYAGCLSAVSSPDLYGVTLDGERGNKAHIMSREDILRDAVRLIFN